MAIVLQKDSRKVDEIHGRVFCNGRYYGDFVVDLGLSSSKTFEEGVYCLHDSLYGEGAIDVVDTKGRTIASLSYKRSSSHRLCVMVGSDGLVFRPSKSGFEAIKELYTEGSNVLVIREPLTMKM
ncbi:MAG: hypothetical protein RR280_04305 [Bacteroidaceae bacterium]